MSNTSIDQLFQITTPTRSGGESSRLDLVDNDLFREHLSRASEVTETKTPTSKSESKIAATEEDEPLEPHTGQQETSTTEQEQSAATNEPSEPTADNSDETAPEEEPTDEVTLSASAAQQAETVVESEQVVSTEGVVETSFADGQQQSGGQTSAELAGTSNESATSATDTEAIKLEAALFGEGGEGETTSENEESSVEAEIESDAAIKTVHSGVGQAVVATVVAGEAKKLQSSAASANAQESLAKQGSTNVAQEILPASEASKNSTPTETSRFQVPSTTINDLAVATDAELALANLNINAEATIDSPSASTPSTGREAVATAGRTPENLLAGKTANTATVNTETSTTETPTVDRARFVQRVGGAIRSAQQRNGQIQLRLSPPELGTLRINIVMNEGVLTAHLETETAAARAVLLDNLPALRERLAEQEIRIEKFDVDVGREGQQQTENRDTDDRQTNRSRSQSNQQSTRAKETSSTVTESDPTQSVTASGLDVRI